MLNKYIDIKWNDDVKQQERYAMEQLISTMLDFAFGYDVEEECFERICEALNEADLKYEVVNDEENNHDVIPLDYEFVNKEA